MAAGVNLLHNFTINSHTEARTQQNAQKQDVLNHDSEVIWNKLTILLFPSALDTCWSPLTPGFEPAISSAAQLYRVSSMTCQNQRRPISGRDSLRAEPPSLYWRKGKYKESISSASGNYRRVYGTDRWLRETSGCTLQEMTHRCHSYRYMSFSCFNALCGLTSLLIRFQIILVFAVN